MTGLAWYKCKSISKPCYHTRWLKHTKKTKKQKAKNKKIQQKAGCPDGHVLALPYV